MKGGEDIVFWICRRSKVFGTSPHSALRLTPTASLHFLQNLAQIPSFQPSSSAFVYLSIVIIVILYLSFILIKHIIVQW
jgi:hypothetical protein